jgi:alpha-mannosidase
LGGQAHTTLRPNFTVSSAESDDLLERPLGEDSELPVGADSSVPLFLRPFQVLTVRLRRP